ncbi:MAG: hypothetical protein ABW127_19430 [Candidatus Thiodiazotropha endolucinida]
MEAKNIISGVMYLTVVGISIATMESKEVFVMIFGPLIPLLMIWYPEEINEFTLGSVGEGGTIDKPIPGFLISGFGWLVLVGILLLVLVR